MESKAEEDRAILVEEEGGKGGESNGGRGPRGFILLVISTGKSGREKKGWNSRF
jgi:hypothetical protein